jgi:hypothetical protein
MRFSLKSIKAFEFKKRINRSIHMVGASVLRDWTLLLSAVFLLLVVLVVVAVVEYTDAVREGARGAVVQDTPSSEARVDSQLLEHYVETLRERREVIRTKEMPATVVERASFTRTEQVVEEEVATSSAPVEAQEGANLVE